jgi:hypothetical protein
MTSVRKLLHITLKRCCLYRFSLQVFLLSMWKLETWVGSCRVDQLQLRWHSGMGFFTIICSMLNQKSTANRGGQANLFYKSANSWTHSLSQSANFLRWASPYIANQQIFMINPQISTKYCTSLSQNSPKNPLCKLFYVKIWTRALYAMFVRRKSLYLRKF